MAVDFLNDEQAARYGRYPDSLTSDQLHQYFRFDEQDRQILTQKKGKHNRLGYALQLATARFLGTFLSDPLDVPDAVLQYVAQQLELPIKAVKVDRYRQGETRWVHRREIQTRYGYKSFSDLPEFLGLARSLYARARLMTEPPSILLDLSTARLIARVQGRVEERFWHDLAARANAAQQAALEALLEVPERSLVSRLDQLRKTPISMSAQGLVGALKRVETIRVVGLAPLDLTGFPAQRLETLSRIGMGVKAQALRRMTRHRRIATLLVTVSRLEGHALDDALTIFDGLLTDLLNRTERQDTNTRLAQLPTLEEAARRSNLLTVAFLERLRQPPRDFSEFAAQVLALVPQDQLQAAADTVQILTRPKVETRIDRLLSRYGYV